MTNVTRIPIKISFMTFFPEVNDDELSLLSGTISEASVRCWYQFNHLIYINSHLYLIEFVHVLSLCPKPLNLCSRETHLLS